MRPIIVNAPRYESKIKILFDSLVLLSKTMSVSKKPEDITNTSTESKSKWMKTKMTNKTLYNEVAIVIR